MYLIFNMKQIKDFPDYYITDEGKVFSYRWENKPREIKGGLMGKGGYKSVTLMINNIKRKHFRTHRLVAEYFVDGYFEGAVVNHKDGNKLNNHYNNLEWVTQQENIKHYYGA